MKKYLLFALVLTSFLIVKSQNFNQLDSVVSANAFINVPLQPHKKNVDIFFNCEKPKQAFYNIRVLDVQGGNSYQDLLNKMQETARNEGFDGVIILGKSTSLTQDNSATNTLVSGLAQGTAAAIAGKNDNDYRRYDPFFTSVNILSAIGIKYKNNMQYVNNIVKRAIVKATKTDTIYFTLNGDLINNGSAIKAANFYDTTLHLFQKADYFATHAMHESAVKHTYDADFSTTIKETSRYGITKYKVIYANDSALHKIQIRIPTSDVLPDIKLYDVVYDLNADKTINKRYVRLGRKVELVFTDSYQYDTNNRCTGFTRYDEKAKTTLLQVNFEYFTMNDLPQIL